MPWSPWPTSDPTTTSVVASSGKTPSTTSPHVGEPRRQGVKVPLSFNERMRKSLAERPRKNKTGSVAEYRRQQVKAAEANGSRKNKTGSVAEYRRQQVKAAAGGAEAKKRRRSALTYDFRRALLKLNRELNPHQQLAKRSLSVLNDYMAHSFEALAGECGRLAKLRKASTLSMRDVQYALRLTLHGELISHAMTSAHRALRNTCCYGA